MGAIAACDPGDSESPSAGMTSVAGTAAATGMNGTAGTSSASSSTASAPNTLPATGASTTGSAKTTAPTTGRGPSDPSNATGVAGCATSSLHASVLRTGAAAGSVYRTISLRNAGSSPCRIKGWSGVSLVGGSKGRQLGAPASRTGSSAPAVVLKQNGSTTFTVRQSQAGNYDVGACDPVAARGYRIYPPNQRAALFLPIAGLQACDNPDTSQLSVGAVGGAS